MNFDKLHVIAVINNPLRYESRYSNYDIFSEDITKKGARLWTLELQTGARPHVVTKNYNKHDVQLWTSSLPGELWHKENMINVTMKHIIRDYPDCRYIAWVDADCKFEIGALEKTVHALQRWDVVQMWSHMVDFCPKGGLVNDHVSKSFMYCYWNNITVNNKSRYLLGGAPGLAWAARRDALNKLGCGMGGPLIDWAILGSGDRNFACSLTGTVDGSLDKRFHPNYLKHMRIYQDNAVSSLKKNVGYVDNTARHLWHGSKSKRGYVSRWEILVKHKFDPETDLARDVSGMLRLVTNNERQWNLRDDIRRYFASRDEDSTTV